MNHYVTKKSTAQSMFNISLLMANSSQLRSALQEGPENRFRLIALIILSITLQVIVGLLLIFTGKMMMIIINAMIHSHLSNQF